MSYKAILSFLHFPNGETKMEKMTSREIEDLTVSDYSETVIQHTNVHLYAQT